MTTNELPLEKRIAAELDVDLTNPPAIPEKVLNSPDLIPTQGQQPQTKLLLEGFESDEISADFLVGVHDLADELGLDLDGISVGHPNLAVQQ